MGWYVTSKNKGDCFYVAGDYVCTEGISNPNLVLVHAMIRPRMGTMKNVTYWHAWVEDGDVVIDLSEGKSGDKARFKKEIYYLLADPQQTQRYTFKETIDKTLSEQNWGPWI
jgi:hypothetical protein